MDFSAIRDFKTREIEKLVMLTTGGINQIEILSILSIIGVSLFGSWGAEIIKRMVLKDITLSKEIEEFTDLTKNYYNPRTETLPLFTNGDLKKLIMPVFYLAGAEDCFYNSKKNSNSVKKIITSRNNKSPAGRWTCITG